METGILTDFNITMARFSSMDLALLASFLALACCQTIQTVTNQADMVPGQPCSVYKGVFCNHG